MSPRVGYLAHTHTYTHTGQPLGEKGGVECARRPHSPVTSLLFRTSGEKTSAAAFPVQLTPSTSRWCARMGGLLCRQQLPLNRLPYHCYTHTHAHTLTSSWEICGLCFLSGCPQPGTPGAPRLVGIWSSRSMDAPLPTDERENKTWERHRSSSSAIVSHISFAVSLLHPRSFPFFSFFCPGGR